MSAGDYENDYINFLMSMINLFDLQALLSNEIFFTSEDIALTPC